MNRGSLVEKVVVFHCNLPIVGDFNCYVDNTGDSDFIKFNRIAELINLKQHDNCSTHIKGHTLVINLRLSFLHDGSTAPPIKYHSKCP